MSWKMYLLHNDQSAYVKEREIQYTGNTYTIYTETFV